MTLARLWKNGLTLIVAACLAGCLGTQPASSGGASPAGIGGDVPSGDGESTFKSAGGDEAASQPKPLPGGAVATGGSWGGDKVLVAFGTGSRCDVVHRTGKQTKTMVSGHLGTYEGKTMPVIPQEPTSINYLRVMDLSGGTAVCSDLKLDAELHFEGEVQIDDPEAVLIFVFQSPLFTPGSEHPACDPNFDPKSSTYFYGSAANEIDTSSFDDETTPVCPKRTS